MCFSLQYTLKNVICGEYGTRATMILLNSNQQKGSI